MIISVASGKGGTGKTTVSTNLAVCLGQEVTLLDCDVEEPNAHLFIHPQNLDVQKVATFVPQIDRERCNGCRLCVDICRFNALTVIRDKAMVFAELCHSCEGCKVVCPEKAVMDSSRLLGDVRTGTRNGLKLIDGCLRVGEAMAPPLIKAVRSKVGSEKRVIIDAPPGTSCPVIHSIKDSDFVLLVTEPTPFGLHDLQLAVEVVRELGLPCGIVVNRSDLGDTKVYDYCCAEKLPILMEIPFDRDIASIYSAGEMLVESRPEWRERFVELYGKIENLVDRREEEQ